VSEAGELIQLAEALHGAGGQRDVIPPGHVKKRRGSYGAFQVHVQLDLRERRASTIAAPGPAGPAAPASRRGPHDFPAAIATSRTRRANQRGQGSAFTSLTSVDQNAGRVE
jgi:hypothetical protein